MIATVTSRGPLAEWRHFYVRVGLARDHATPGYRRAIDTLHRLEAFTSLNGPAWYGLPVNTDTITLVKRAEPVAYPAKIETGAGPVTLFDPMFPVHWNVA